MKWFIGFFVLLVALVAISGCTQPAQTVEPTTTVPTTVPTTEPVIVATPVPTTIATPVVTTIATTIAVTTVPTTVSTTQTAVSNATVAATPVPNVTAASMITTIHITSTGFNPALDVVYKGTGITWVNDDTVPHAVKAIGKNDGLFISDSIIPTSQFKYDFGNEGTIEYALVDLPTIKGTIVVKGGNSQ